MFELSDKSRAIESCMAHVMVWFLLFGQITDSLVVAAQVFLGNKPGQLSIQSSLAMLPFPRPEPT